MMATKAKRFVTRSTLLFVLVFFLVISNSWAAALSKTQGTAVLAHQAVIHPNTVKGSAQDVSTHFAATVVLFHASVEATANTNSGTFLIQVSASSSGDEDWGTIVSLVATSSTADTEAMTATEPAAETVMAVASTTGFVAGDDLYIQDAGTLADSEWARCQEIVTNTSINLIDGLTSQKDSSDVIWNDADVWVVQVDLTAVGRIRVVFQHEGATGANVHVKAIMITGDSIS